MCYLDGRRRRQSLVYFGKPCLIRECRSGAVCSGSREGIFLARYSKIWSRRTTMINSEFGSSFILPAEA